MEALEVAQKIQSLVDSIQEECQRGEALGVQKAEANRDYDKALAVEVMKLRENGIPVSIIDKVAKGNISAQKYRLEIAESAYKSHFSRLESLRQMMNGYQSINKFLSFV